MNEEKTIKKFFQNRDILKWIIVGLAVFVVLILVFGAGIKVGTMKAKYSYHWAENYHRNFGGPRGGFLGDLKSFPQGDLSMATAYLVQLLKSMEIQLLQRPKMMLRKPFLSPTAQ